METKSKSRLHRALRLAETELLARRTPAGIWTGELSASALSTATAVAALTLAQRAATNRGSAFIPVKRGKPSSPPTGPISRFDPVIERGFDWLAARANPDGGWGDTILSRSNISTTTLVWAALGLLPPPSGARAKAVQNAEKWLTQHVGSLDPGALAAKIIARYGSDRTFSAPILTHCALCGRLGSDREAWRYVISLPFELAAFPAKWFAALRLPVVSYALPALIAIGYARHFHAPSGFPPLRALRSAVAGRVFDVLGAIQPPNGGFLEAIPLTSFVVMSLAGSGKLDHPVAQRGLDFILNSAQPDGSWRIDTNLSTWVTTQAVHALASPDLSSVPSASSVLSPDAPTLTPPERNALCQWLLRQQYRARHPYTNAAPGGWAWTDLPGGVPDGDDTPGALLALKALGTPGDIRPTARHLCPSMSAVVNFGNPGDTLKQAVTAGVEWLLGLQNRDGGIPTFCRGWGNLPFDRSSADLTAHCLRAWAAWRPELPPPLRHRIARATERAERFLRQAQEPQGAWRPLWFGNEFEPDECNRVYGTSRVLLALAETGVAPDCARTAALWLVHAQKPDGGWSGGLAAAPSSIEETALAVEALGATLENALLSRGALAPMLNPETSPRSIHSLPPFSRGSLEAALRRGTDWLAARVEDGTWTIPAPIGFYFAKLWYYEKLYPIVFTVAALRRAARVLP
jgi:squalene-hopene/tetraprenyl-beta-curcumene cyclase